jgi:hypothetical protein
MNRYCLCVLAAHNCSKSGTRLTVCVGTYTLSACQNIARSLHLDVFDESGEDSATPQRNTPNHRKIGWSASHPFSFASKHPTRLIARVAQTESFFNWQH